MKTLFIRPLDTQFYRDGRPFDAGSESEARSVFPPYPRTVYGACRTAIIWSQAGSNWDPTGADPRWSSLYPVVGTVNGFGSLTIRGPVPGRTYSNPTTVAERLFPVPLDLVNLPKRGREAYALVHPCLEGKSLSDTSNFRWRSLNPARLSRGSTELIEAVPGYLSEYYVQGYLTGDCPGSGALLPLSEVHRVESRIGLARDIRLRTAQAGLLYAAPHVRMADGEGRGTGGLVVEVEEDRDLLPPKGILRLGGDSRPAEFMPVSNRDWSDVIAAAKDKVLGTGRFKAVLVTPAIFGTGWYPAFLDEDSEGLAGTLAGMTVRLAGACVGRPIPIGGFNLASTPPSPKPIQKAVPAGSVFFFQVQGWDSSDAEDKQRAVDELFTRFFYRSLCQDPEAKEGFGVALIGGW